MARPIKSSVIVNVGIRITNYYEDGKSTFIDLYKGDMVEDLQYVDTQKQEVVTLSGRITDVTTTIITGISTSYRDIAAPYAERVTANYVTVDHSEQYDSKITKIPTREILEYQNEDKEIVRVSVTPILKVDLTVTLSDGTVTHGELEEGCTISNAIIMTPEGDKALDLSIKGFVFTIVPKTMITTVSAIILDDTKDTKVDILAIKSCGNPTVIVEEGELQETIDKLSGNGIDEALTLASDTYKEELSIKEMATLKGFYALKSASSGDRRSDVIDAKETVFVKKLVAEAGADVVVQGVTFTEDAYIKIADARSVVFKNCKFVGINPDMEKTYLIQGTPAEKFYEKRTYTKLCIEGCYFGDNNTDGTNKVYHVLEPNFALAKGSYIKNCYFSSACASHNIINIYDVEDGATINITGNHFEKSASALRIGTIGDVTATINLSDNSYDKTDEDAKYAGLVTFQPYSKRTVSMGNLRVNIENTTINCENKQVYCTFRNASDTEMDSTKWPKLYINGKKTVITEGDEENSEASPTA